MSILRMLIRCVSILSLFILSGCQQDNVPSPPVEVQVFEEPYLTETPVPECVILPDVKLVVDVLSTNTVEIKITGLSPNEPVYVIYSSEAQDKGKSLGCCEGVMADEKGNYRQIEALRLPDRDEEFKQWKVQVVHSRGSACAEFILPDP